MANDPSQQFFGATPQREDYADFLQRFQADATSISTEEAARRYRELISHAPPEVAAEVNSQIIGQLPHEDRQHLAHHITLSDTPQSGAQPPDMLDQLLGKDSPLNTPLGRMILSAAVAYLARRLLGGQQGQSGAQEPMPQGGGLVDLLSGLLGGAQQPASGGGIADILSGLLGGEQSASVGAGGGLSDLLGALTQGNTPSEGQDPAAPNPAPLGHIRKKE
jgi:hypothetical protein